MSNDLKAIKKSHMPKPNAATKAKKAASQKSAAALKAVPFTMSWFFSFKALLGGRRSKKATSVRFGEPLFHIFFSSTLANKLLFDEACEESKFEKAVLPA
ncbi:MAG: hypothetical protein L6V88_11870 [Anaerotruncus sp.]|nr:MAG: hypothetical protein L6V88_11870 [Anaerotruncus sp.]